MLFFPGRIDRGRAEDLCGSHGGSVVVPKDEEENKIVSDLYNQNKKDCKDDISDVIGWLGATISDAKVYSTQYGSHTGLAQYTNFDAKQVSFSCGLFIILFFKIKSHIQH